MSISFMQMHPQYIANNDTNLGILLLEFLEFYGRKFDYANFGIRIKNGGKHLPRHVFRCPLVYMNRPSLLCIESPFVAGLNVARLTYRLPEIRHAFDDAFVTLLSALAGYKSSDGNNCAKNSILGRIVRVSNQSIEYRKWIQSKGNERYININTNTI